MKRAWASMPNKQIADTYPSTKQDIRQFVRHWRLLYMAEKHALSFDENFFNKLGQFASKIVGNLRDIRNIHHD